MSEMSDTYGLLPDDPPAEVPLPPGADPADAVQQEAGRQAAGAVGDVVGGVLDGVGGVVDVVELGAAAVEVSGSVVSGALEALGSGTEVLGGCLEGCSFLLAVVVLLGTACSLLAFVVVP
jgi:hypothetical protein